MINCSTSHTQSQSLSYWEDSNLYDRCRYGNIEVVQDLWPLGTHFPLPLSPKSTCSKECLARITHANQVIVSRAAHKSKHEGATPKCTLTLPLHHLHDGKTFHLRPRMQQPRNKILVVAQRRRHGSTSALRYHFTTKSAWVACESCRIASKGKSRVREQEWKADGLKCDEE
jgi:hypothetical protein